MDCIIGLEPTTESLTFIIAESALINYFSRFLICLLSLAIILELSTPFLLWRRAIRFSIIVILFIGIVSFYFSYGAKCRCRPATPVPKTGVLLLHYILQKSSWGDSGQTSQSSLRKVYYWLLSNLFTLTVYSKLRINLMVSVAGIEPAKKPPSYQLGALPTELHRHITRRAKIFNRLDLNQ